MKALIFCLCTATTVAWPSGVYILDTSGNGNQYYNPLTEPHSQTDLPINFREEYTGAAVSAGRTVHAAGVSGR